MKAVRIDDAGLVLCDVDEPDGAGLVADVLACSICGTDLDLVAMGAQGFTLGHEMTVSVGGEAYAVEPTVRCGNCEQCRAGFTQRCTGEHANLGIFADGGLAERVHVHPYGLVALPAGLGADDACLVEPTAVALHGVRRAALERGERVLVVGGGSIGLLAVASLRAQGHDVDLEARHDFQTAAGERLGAARPTGDYDVVIDAAGSESGLARCTELARPGGRIVLLGVYYGQLPIPAVPLLVKELTCIPAMAYGRHDGVREVEEAAAMLAANPDVGRTLLTHRFPLDDAAEAFRVAGDRSAGAIKVVLAPS